MRKLRALWKDRSGKGSPLILAVVLVCILLSTVIFEYARLQLTAQGVRDAVQSAVVDVAAQNWDEAYAGLREGYAGGYELTGAAWYQNVTSGNVYGRLKDVLGLQFEGGRYVKYSGPDAEYLLSGLTLGVENAPLAPSDPMSAVQLNVTGAITLQVPLSFGWSHLPMMEIELQLKSSYVPKF